MLNSHDGYTVVRNWESRLGRLAFTGSAAQMIFAGGSVRK